jgi:hypothetical protein
MINMARTIHVYLHDGDDDRTGSAWAMSAIERDELIVKLKRRGWKQAQNRPPGSA